MCFAANNPNIISTAEIPDPHASEEWVEFAVPFKMRAGKSIDRKKLEEGKYSITVVMRTKPRWRRLLRMP